ncbi:MAG: response regulator transcription factor [Oscillospiraceae bacterium]|nr:response regulator transcription factor [Oscillospiraceae bacterium]MCI9363687.1 response regulator transcription factor [Oscillospiraceae bacterium]
MLKIAVCDDEENTRTYLAALIQKQGIPCEITEYASPEDYLVKDSPPDLLFLDVQMDHLSGPMDGVALAKHIRSTDKTQPVIIFITGHQKYVFDAFDVGAFQYLLKPVDEQKFSQVFKQAVRQIEEKQKNPPASKILVIQYANTVRRLLWEDISYLESCNHKVIFHLRDETFQYYAKIGDLEAQLQNDFFRIHKGYLVNLSYIESYNKTEAVLTTGERLLISKYKYRDFVKAYLRFLKQEDAL